MARQEGSRRSRSEAHPYPAAVVVRRAHPPRSGTENYAATRGLAALGADPGRAAELAEAWRPYRGFAVAHLWAAAGERQLRLGRGRV